MSDAEKQEGQKTVVAFIAGLLIGGLLVWVFSTTPESAPSEAVKETDTETVSSEDGSTDGEVKTTNDAAVVKSVTKTNEVKTGDANMVVEDQKAGYSVTLGKTTYPANAGWVVVRDYADGRVGNVLGAARFDVKEGLTPASVSLLRATVAGKTYQVVFHSENGDKVFKLANDRLVEGFATTFKAQ